MPIPVAVLQRNRNVTLARDVIYVNGIRFINTIYRYIKFMTAEHIANSEASTLQNSIKQVKRIYMQRGFKTVNILIDGQFKCIRGDLEDIQVLQQ